MPGGGGGGGITTMIGAIEIKRGFERLDHVYKKKKTWLYRIEVGLLSLREIDLCQSIQLDYFYGGRGNMLYCLVFYIEACTV